MNSLRYRPHYAWISAALMLTASFMALLAPRVCLAEDKADRQHLPLQHVSDVSLPGRASRFDYESGDLDRHLLAECYPGRRAAIDCGFNRSMQQIG
jgi:hypothetical protein